MLLTTIFSALASYVYIAHAWKVFEVPHVDGQDDTPALAAALANFTADSTILFKKGVTYNIFTPITFPVFTNVEVRIEGNLTYPEDIPTVQGEDRLSGIPYRFSFSGGTNVTLRGSTDPHWGWVDAHGQAWWDAMEQTNRPHGWAFRKITNGVIRDMKLWKPIAWSFSTSGSTNLHAFNNKIVAVSNSQVLFPSRDADIVLILCLGFSAGGTNMLFENNWIQNGDDCITVGNGAKNIHFRNAYCEGGHGLSIGSLGKGGQVADVQNVLIENVVMKSSLYGARFKSWTGGQGLARNITWKDIAFIDVPFPFLVAAAQPLISCLQVGPKPNGTGTLNNTHIQDITFKNFAGTIKEYVLDNVIS
ncbi:glycoside hydrolase family 28 protein [Pleurotus ostreatus PC15]|uniref:galacturonan 1,4-alpha-galacturonidase n=1 Tax=Pleurotus ostreatus (strain PC15) TaxID=1137138 RepID=A0A067P6Q0_PLEO1|nr:glycoside hydrolase family 28 protein [Pleurotus ostreatus PC15]